MARLSARSITQSGNNGGNDGGGAFIFTLGYSTTTGFLNTLTYPKSSSSFALNLQYGYAYGLLQSVTDTSDSTSTCGSTCTLWTANAMNGRGQVTQETLGNGVVTNRTYDPVTSWLTAATAGVGGGAALLNQSYLQDENGNITQRQNNSLGLTESFSYDADQRLTCTALSSTCSSQTFYYDGGSAGPGNITKQVGVGTYTYPTPGPLAIRPHAVTSITGTFNGIVNPSFTYDNNGNMTNRAGSSISWSTYNYPTAISASDPTGSEEVQFSYGPDRQRWEQIYTGPSGTEQTYYVGNGAMPAPGQLEVVFNGATNYRHYIYAGSEPVAVYSRTSTGGITMSYFLEDHQGGVSAIASNSGAADVDDSFSAFGQLRNSQTWSGAPTSTELNALFNYTRQGYTFQTGLGQSMGLNHMNGRVQDAILGRFLSPDPYIPDPTNAQSYNRYTYALNNPLTWIDPTGFDQCNPGDNDYNYNGCLGSDPGYTPSPLCPEDSDCTDPQLPDTTVTGVRPGQVVVNYGGGASVTINPDGTIAELTAATPAQSTSPTNLACFRYGIGCDSTVSPAQSQSNFQNSYMCQKVGICDPSQLPPPVITVCGGGGFGYGGPTFHVGPAELELLGIVSYDSDAGGQHGGLIAGGAGNYTFGFEAMRTWSNWQETISPIGFVNGPPVSVGPLGQFNQGNAGGLFEYNNGQLSVGGYLGGSTSTGVAAGVGGYLNVSFTGSCPAQPGSQAPTGN